MSLASPRPQSLLLLVKNECVSSCERGFDISPRLTIVDKGAERTALREVYGPAVERAATDHERPDFLLTLPGVGILGIEATSVFAGSGAAKLHHLADYSLGLLDGTQPMHRADHGEFVVDDVTIEREEDRKSVV